MTGVNEIADCFRTISEPVITEDGRMSCPVKKESGRGTSWLIDYSEYLSLFMADICLNSDFTVEYPRAPEYFEIACCLGGSLCVECPKKKTLALGEDDILLSKGCIRDGGSQGVVKFNGGERRCCIICRFDRDLYSRSHSAIGGELWNDLLFPGHIQNPAVLLTGCQPRIGFLLRQIFETEIDRPSLRKLFIESKIMEVLTLLAGSNLDDREPMRLSREEVGKIRKVPCLMMEDAASPYTIELLAEKLDMDVCRLKKGFKYLYLDTIYSYFKKQKLQHAARLLRTTDKTVLEIALDAGYMSQSQFGVSFKKHYGLTPFEYSKTEIPL